MNQLDRIEYMLRYNSITDKRFTFVKFLSYIGGFFLLFLHLGIFGIIFYVAFDNMEPLYSIISIMGELVKPFIIFMAFLYFVDVILFIRNSNKLDKRFMKGGDDKMRCPGCKKLIRKEENREVCKECVNKTIKEAQKKK